MSNITILSTEIRQYEELFSLNDLHKASGGEEKHKPKFWLTNKQTKELASEIQKGGILPFKVHRGTKGGTYACRELVIAYAAWISAAFHLKVIRVFLDNQKQSVPLPGSKQSSRLNLAYQQIDEGRRILLSRLPDGSTKIRINQKQAIKELYPQIKKLREAGATFEEITADLHQIGMVLSACTLKTYYYDETRWTNAKEKHQSLGEEPKKEPRDQRHCEYTRQPTAFLDSLIIEKFPRTVPESQLKEMFGKDHSLPIVNGGTGTELVIEKIQDIHNAAIREMGKGCTVGPNANLNFRQRRTS